MDATWRRSFTGRNALSQQLLPSDDDIELRRRRFDRPIEEVDAAPVASDVVLRAPVAG
jgi:hypothetical protein